MNIRRKDAAEGMQRAYSLLTIKSVDDDKRILTGTATTPSPDRYDDVVEPKGAQYKLPLPFLWQHNSAQPIGHVIKATVTKDGIDVTVQLVKVDEPGALKDRLDEAWQSIKAGLVRGLSIGFRSIEHSWMDDTNGIRFIKWDWLELSAVTIPANADCSIQTVKSHDTHLPAASGQRERGVVRLDKPPGASGTPAAPAARAATTVVRAIEPKPQEGNMNTQQKIEQFKAARAAKAKRMDEIMEGAGESTLDAAQEEEYDTLKGEVATIDKHLERLEAHERSVALRAAVIPNQPGTGGVIAASPAEVQRFASASRGGSDGVIAVAKKEAPGIAFARLAGAIAFSKGNFRDAYEFAKERFPNETPTHDILKMMAAYGSGDAVLKAAVAAGTTTGSGWADALVNYQVMSTEFIEFLRPQTILGKFGQNGVPSLRRVPFNIKVPRQTNGGSASWVGEGKPKPLTALAFDNVTLKWTKLATIAVLSEELVRFSEPSAETIVRDSLAGAIIQQMDSDFVNPSNAGTTDVKPASITNGVTPVVSGGDTEEHIIRDIKGLFAPWIAANLSPASAVYIMSATTALSLSLMLNPLGQPSFPNISMNGGTLKGIPVIVSEAVGNIVVLVNANDVLLADEGQVSIDASREASLQMDSAPTSPVDASTVLVSLWQHNMVGIKAERYVNWVKGRSAAAQYLSGVEWGLEST